MTNPDAEVVRRALRAWGTFLREEWPKHGGEWDDPAALDPMREALDAASRLEAQAALVPQLEESAEHVARELRRQAAAPTWGKRDAVAKWLVVLANRLSSIPSQEERA